MVQTLQLKIKNKQLYNDELDQLREAIGSGLMLQVKDGQVHSLTSDTNELNLICQACINNSQNIEPMFEKESNNDKASGLGSQKVESTLLLAQADKTIDQVSEQIISDNVQAEEHKKTE